jgi:hypothetical protein
MLSPNARAEFSVRRSEQKLEKRGALDTLALRGLEELFGGEGQTERPRACDRGNGWAHSAGKSTVDHDKWLQVGISVAIKATGGAFTHPPLGKKITPTPAV